MMTFLKFLFWLNISAAAFAVFQGHPENGIISVFMALYMFIVILLRGGYDDKEKN